MKELIFNLIMAIFLAAHYIDERRRNLDKD